eukprot:TRINITY_DN10270_c0_g1_i1.p1 TRINITY_DN10270_c0_g1~~TRINITY_DN10270_c0_g1_i1.p1  ORF type:complete len:196 (+),score=53.81 TRINITY_DN10270_c0_g1_i1:73-660(+)
MNGHTKGKGYLEMYEKENPKEKLWNREDKFGLITGGYVLAKANTSSDWMLAQIIEKIPIKMPKEEFQEHNDDYYDYYVTFPGIDRRHDCKISRENIDVNVEAIKIALKKQEIKKIEEQKNEVKMILFHNNENEGMNEKQIELHNNYTKIKYITQIIFGDIPTPTWYYSPYPEPFHNLDTLYICEYCLHYLSLIHI